MTKTLLLIGAGGHASSVSDIAMTLGYKIICAIEESFNHIHVNQKKRLAQVVSMDRLTAESKYNFCIAVGDNWQRERLNKKIQSLLPYAKPISLIHPSAVISKTARISPGTVIMPQAVVGANSIIGQNVIINTGAIIEHDCSAADFSSLGPRSVMGGFSELGYRSAVCIGAIVSHRIKIGDDVVLGGGAFLRDHLPSCCIAFGVPAQRIRDRQPFDPYL